MRLENSIGLYQTGLLALEEVTCTESHMLSIVIPYRERPASLATLLEVITGRFTSDYEVVIVEQTDDRPFNRGALMNIGYKTCTGSSVCFHDVDMLPVLADYSEVDHPTCLIARCSLFNDSLPYERYFGGVTLFSRKNVEEVNGFSNSYFAWGKEDDDMWLRCERTGMNPGRRPGIFYHQEHSREHCTTNNSSNDAILERFIRDPRLQWSDGLTSLRYDLVKEQRFGATLRLLVRL